MGSCTPCRGSRLCLGIAHQTVRRIHPHPPYRARLTRPLGRSPFGNATDGGRPFPDAARRIQSKRHDLASRTNRVQAAPFMTLPFAWFQLRPHQIPVPGADITLGRPSPAKAAASRLTHNFWSAVAEGASPQPPLSKRAILSVPSAFSALPPLRLHRSTAEEAETSAGTTPP